MIYSTLLSSGANAANPRDAEIRNTKEYIQDWRDSIIKLGLHATVFFDNLPPSTAASYSTDKIQFKSVPKIRMNNCDARWSYYKSFLECETSDFVFMTDISDVVVKMNPFLEMKKLPGYGNRLFVGDEPNMYSHRWIQQRAVKFQYIYPEIYEHFTNPENQNLTLYNAGILGGSTPLVREFIDIMVNALGTMGIRRTTMDMLAFNYVLRSNFMGRITSGAPVNSLFKGYEKDREDVWFIHK
jgi:hypothetical protein